MLRWILAIVVVAFFVIFIINIILPLFSSIEIKDTSYAPRDIERKYHELEKKRGGRPE